MGPYSKLLARPPGPLDFPHNFNPHAVNIWFAACVGLPSDTRSAWVTALRLYKAGCKSAGLLPFAEADQDTNIAIRNYLYTQRRHFVRFLNTTKLMVGLKVLHNLKREARVETYGFSIMVEAQMRITDPAWMQTIFKLPAGYRFNRMRDSKRRYLLELDPGLIVFVYNQQITSPDRWYIGYEIRVPMQPSYSTDVDMDMEAKSQFILDQLWRPLMNTYRGRGLDRIRHL